ncbi:MAG: S-layer homology domain-containing protein [Actinomycetota bacterium]
MHRRRLLQILAATPAVPLLPALAASPAGAVGGGRPIGSGAVVDAGPTTGMSLSWTRPAQPAPSVRTLIDGVWGDVVRLDADHGHGPDDPAGRNHSPLVLDPAAEAYWVDAGGTADLRIHEIAAPPRRLAALADDDLLSHEPIPGLVIIDRSEWTDVERLDTIDCQIPSSVYGLGCRSDVGLRHAVVHHTVNVNTYGEADVPGLIWSIQRFHMETRGWDDIAYNFIVDRFGRIWHAREGELEEPITGGHTTGLNAESVGVAVLGTFGESAVPDEVVTSIGILLGWKLSLHGVDPLGHGLVRSAGGDFAEPGDFVDVDNISGHRDNQQTSCPGTFLYERVDEIRAAAAELVPIFGSVRPTYTLDDVTLDGWSIDRFAPDTVVDVEVVVDGGEPIVVPADIEVEGLDADYPDAGAGHGFAHVVPIDIDTTSIVVRVEAGDGTPADLMDLTLFATFIDVEPDRFFAPGVYFLRKNELTTGTLPGLFEPMDFVTRGQMATFLHRFMDLPEWIDEAPFEDLVDDAFYLEAVHWLAESGITTGTSPTTFSPDDFVTRGQMAAFIWRMCGEPEPTTTAPFDDVPPFSYFATAVSWMAELGITTGILPTKYGPEQQIRRGEMATFLFRLATTAEAWTEVDAPSSAEF